MFSALDLETAPCDHHPQEYALQPWRAQEGTARITSLAIADPERKPFVVSPDRIESTLAPLTGAPVATWNGVFDVAWLLASGYEPLIKKIRWWDAMLLWKWVDNSQVKEYYDPIWSLVAGVNRWLSPKEHTWVPAFLRLKAEEPPAGERDDYWQIRAQFDALATRLIAEKAWQALTDRQRNAATIEASCILPVAQSWLTGVLLDVTRADEMMPAITDEMQEIEMRLGVYTAKPDFWLPSTILRSPKQLAQTLYDKWMLTCVRETPKGAPSTDKAALTYLADQSDKALQILRWRELNTQFTKFIQGIHKTHSYLGSDVCHPQPKIFSTYTGRMTYASKSGSKGAAAKAKIGVPIHQWPRPKALRRLVKAPPGKAIVEFDAAGQEMRLMACLSRDSAMLQVFNSRPPYDDIHSFMGARLANMTFDAFLSAKAAGEESVVGPTGYRYQGKFNNLSRQYRIGDKNLRIKSRVDYGMQVDRRTVRTWTRTYHQTFAGVKHYWDQAIAVAKRLGYAESMAGRRYGLNDWWGDREFSTGQSAINFPIQATGGDQKELALSLLTSKFPALEFFMDLHDGLYFYADISNQLPEMLTEALHMLNTIDYQTHWGWRPVVPLVWDCAVGITWGDKQELKNKRG